MNILECDFLHCQAEEPLIVLFQFDGRTWRLCAFHDKLVNANGASVERENGKDYLFSPVMQRGFTE